MSDLRMSARLSFVLLSLLVSASCGLQQGHLAHPRVQAAAAVRPSAYAEAILPFTEDENGIHVTAAVGGKTVPALVDTGTSWVVWPRTLHLASTPHLVRQGNRPPAPGTILLYGPTGEPFTGHMRRLAQIRIGAMALTDFNSLRLETYRKSGLGDCLLLGTMAFAQGSLTIDYPQRRLIVRTGGYDPAREIRTPGTCVVPFIWAGGDKISPGVPVIAAQVEGHPAHLILDTGAENLVLRNKMALEMPASAKTQDGSIASPVARARGILLIRGLSVSVGDKVLKGVDAAVVPSRESDAASRPLQDGSLGCVLLKSYRLTIDYPRRCIVLEPYDLEKPKKDRRNEPK